METMVFIFLLTRSVGRGVFICTILCNIPEGHRVQLKNKGWVLINVRNQIKKIVHTHPLGLWEIEKYKKKIKEKY